MKTLGGMLAAAGVALVLAEAGSRAAFLPPEGGSHVIASGGSHGVVLSPSGGNTTITVHYTPRDQQAVRYEYVPFTVPRGTTKIAVSYQYDKAGDTNVVDLGLYEPGPLTLGTKTFRGWSGGAQASVSVGVNDASPGYWPGPIPPGEWHVQLGLYKVAPAGVDVRVTIATSDAPPTGEAPVVRRASASPLRTGAAWYAGSMHTHTVNSDGALTPEQLVFKARDEGLDFLVITDHNNTAHQLASIDRHDLLVISGEEVTTPGGHFNVWGLGGARDYVDFRILPGDPAIETVVKSARARGALVSINHPIADCFACTWTHEIPPGVDAIEIGNGTPAAREQAMVMWDTLLREGRRITAVGESDWHRGPLPVSMPSVRVWARELSTPAILDGVRGGHVIVMASGALRPPDVAITAGGADVAIGDEASMRAGEPVRVRVKLPEAGYDGARVDLVWRGEVVGTARPSAGVAQFERFPAESGYFRVHVVSGEGAMLAVTNPVFLKVPRR